MSKYEPGGQKSFLVSRSQFQELTIVTKERPKPCVSLLMLPHPPPPLTFKFKRQNQHRYILLILYFFFIYITLVLLSLYFCHLLESVSVKEIRNVCVAKNGQFHFKFCLNLYYLKYYLNIRLSHNQKIIHLHVCNMWSFNG